MSGLAAFFAQTSDDDSADAAEVEPPVVNGVAFGNPNLSASTSSAPATPLPTSAARSGNPPTGPGGTPSGGLAAFYAQPDEDEPPARTPASIVNEALDLLGFDPAELTDVGGTIVGLVLADDSERTQIVWSRP